MTSAARGFRIAASLLLLAGSALPARAQRGCAPAASAGGWPSPLDRRVSLRASDLTLRDALDRLSASARIVLSYSPDLLPLDRRVCLLARDVPLGDALRALLRGTTLEPGVVAGQVVLAPAARAPGTAAAPDSAAAVRSSVLDAIVVTGSPGGGRRRDLAVAMDAVSGDRLARRSATTLADALNAAAPGVWLWRQAPSTLMSQFASMRGASSFGATYPKVYVDGVEAANPLLVGTLDPDDIERVEVIRGPQGAALYGSDAISGVINIISRHAGGDGAARRPELVSRAGATSSSFAAAPLATHDERIALRTGSNLASGSLTVNVGGTGAIYPEASTRSLGASAAGRWVLPTAIVSVSARVLDRRAGVGRNPLLEDRPASGLADTLRQRSTHYTLSAATTIATHGRWTHTLLAGVDGYGLDYLEDALGPFPVAADSGVRLASGSGMRGIVRGASTLRVEDPSGRASGSLTVAAEYAALRESTEPRAGETPALPVWRNDTGLMAEASGALDDTWFVTAGLRLERNDAIANHDAALLPLLGAAWVHDLGGAELKLRGAYGRGIRAPQTPARSRLRAPGREVMADLDPEVQAGVELGAELYVGRSFSVSATRFDQRASGLIQDVVVGFDELVGAAGRSAVYALQNVGAIDNRGWEAQATVSHRGLTLAGGMALVDSRVARLAPGYLGDLKPGDRMLGVPAATATLTAEWMAPEWSGSLGLERAWDWVNYDRRTLAARLAAGDDIPVAALYGPGLRGYWVDYHGSTEVRATLWRRLTPGVWLTAAADNLLGRQIGEPDNASIRPGRTLTMGIRASF